METDAGIPLTEEEIKLIKSLKRVAKKWQKDGKRLWLFSGSGTLNVMLHGSESVEENPEPEMLPTEGVNPKNCITIIEIPNDGGDW